MGSCCRFKKRRYIMWQFALLSLLVGVASSAASPGHGPVLHGGCHREPATIMVTLCDIELDRVCSAEDKVVGEAVHYEPECVDKEVEICHPVHHRYHGRFHGKRSAIELKCTTITKKLCKPKQVKEEVTKTVETCVEAPKQVCKDVPKHLSQVTCEKIVHWEILLNKYNSVVNNSEELPPS